MTRSEEIERFESAIATAETASELFIECALEAVRLLRRLVWAMEDRLSVDQRTKHEPYGEFP